MIMEKIIVNELSHEGMRRVKVISDARIDLQRWLAAVPLEARELIKAELSEDKALGVHHLSMSWPARDKAEFGFSQRHRRMLVWKILENQRASQAIREAVVAYMRWRGVGVFPKFVFMKSLPKGAENGMLMDDVIILQAEWALEGCVILGGRNDG